MRTTVTIQIGNSDDKLSQSKWANFVRDLDRVVDALCVEVHFSGHSASYAPWQNYCVVATLDDAVWRLSGLRGGLQTLAERYGQDAIALTTGTTVMVKP